MGQRHLFVIKNDHFGILLSEIGSANFSVIVFNDRKKLNHFGCNVRKGRLVNTVTASSNTITAIL